MDPSKLSIKHYPAAVLRQKAALVSASREEVRAVFARMIEVMRKHEGIGLAAPQVGLSWRMFVADVPAEKGRSASETPPTATDGPVAYINPVLSNFSGVPVRDEEGCLSLPDIRGQVLRPPVVTITYTDLEGATRTLTGAGLLARCWQHEVDHLDGVLIIDKFSQMSRLKNRSAIRELERGVP